MFGKREIRIEGSETQITTLGVRVEGNNEACQMQWGKGSPAIFLNFQRKKGERLSTARLLKKLCHELDSLEIIGQHRIIEYLR